MTSTPMLLSASKSVGEIWSSVITVWTALGGTINGPALDVVHPVARPIVNTQFADAFANWLHIAGIPARQTPDSCCDSRPCLSIPKPPQPDRERIRLPNFDHKDIVVHKLQ